MARVDDGILATDLAGLTLRNPVLLAAGTAGVLDEMSEVADLSALGGLVTKSITAESREGNPAWRVAPLDVGMLNAVGLANPGVKKFLAEHAGQIPSVPTQVIVSVAGFGGVESYTDTVRTLAAHESVTAFELNVSCPNVHGGTEFGADPEALGELVRASKQAAGDAKLFVKLSPIAVGKITISDIARAAIDASADALTIANTIPAMAIDPETRLPLLGNITGGLSGPAMHPVTLKLVRDVYLNVAKESDTPIIGAGGVVSWREAASFILAGATAVQIGTGSFARPNGASRVAKGLAAWAKRQRADRIADLIGGLRAG